MTQVRPVHVLLVDDDPDQREMYAEGLRFAGLHVITACSSSEGMELATRGPLDVLVVDALLRGPDRGWDLARQVKRHPRLSGVRVLLLTAAALPAQTEAEIQTCCDVVLEKPCLPDALAAHITEAAGSTARPQTPPRWVMSLYLSSRSANSAGVEERLRRQVHDAGASPHVDIVVHDLSIDPEAGQAEGISYTPSLVIRMPNGERRVVVGDLRDRDALRTVLYPLDDAK